MYDQLYGIAEHEDFERGAEDMERRAMRMAAEEERLLEMEADEDAVDEGDGIEDDEDEDEDLEDDEDEEVDEETLDVTGVCEHGYAQGCRACDPDGR